MRIHIKTPFWGAYKMYGWDKGIPGIGFRKSSVDALATVRGEKIELTIGKDKTLYAISPITIQNQAKKYRSTFKARYDVMLYVVPQNKLRKVL